jgi:hypothetical protein
VEFGWLIAVDGEDVIVADTILILEIGFFLDLKE